MILAALAMVGWFSWIGVTLLRDHRQVTDDTHAAVCTAPADALDGTGDCRLTVNGTIDGVLRQSGKNAQYLIYVTFGSEQQAISFPGDSPMLANAAPGAQATVNIWRSTAVTVADDHGTAVTSDSPQVAVDQDIELLAVGEGIAVLVMCGSGWSLYAKHAKSRRRGPSYFVVIGLPALGIAIIGFGFAAVAGAGVGGAQIGTGVRVAVVFYALVLIGCAGLTANRYLRLR